MGRPRKQGVLITAVSDNRVLSWCDGKFAGDAEFLAKTRQAIEEQRTVFLGQNITADHETPLGATAAILSVHGAKLITAPEDILRHSIILKNLRRVHNV